MANILGINTGKIGWLEAKAAIEKFYNDGKSHLIVTPNPEIILAAQKDEELFYLLNHADLSLADGFGLKIAAKLSGQELKRLTGADLLPYLLEEANNKSRKVLIIKPQNSLSSEQDMRLVLSQKYPKASSLIISTKRQPRVEEQDLEKIKSFSPELAICLLGAPEQEKYLHNLIINTNCLPIAAGLGGAFDFLSGRVRRAPKIMRRGGLEWLWRFIKQPERWRRIWRATFVFVYKLIIWRFFLPYRYRPNVAVLMYRQTPSGRDIFIVERQGQSGHWQLPQGGLDELDLVSAGSKEIREESGAINFKIIASYKKLYRYEFAKENGRYQNIEGEKHFGYRGQEQGLLIVEFTGKPEEIKINYWDHQAWSWINEKEFLKTLHPCRQEAAAIYLQKLQNH
ncbi:MAG: WecB/TagA/CpsF family glycosyltransferase [Patescibacteria group bacterium]|nr:WecB/TagA/CpsF family glycosyltransferase [Patescibacteria group bacterium]